MGESATVANSRLQDEQGCGWGDLNALYVILLWLGVVRSLKEI